MIKPHLSLSRHRLLDMDFLSLVAPPYQPPLYCWTCPMMAVPKNTLSLCLTHDKVGHHSYCLSLPASGSPQNLKGQRSLARSLVVCPS